MDDLKPPSHLSFDGDVPSNWENWKQLFELYLTDKELEKKEDKQKIAILLTATGAETVARFNQFSWDNCSMCLLPEHSFMYFGCKVPSL